MLTTFKLREKLAIGSLTMFFSLIVKLTPIEPLSTLPLFYAGEKY